MKKVSYLLVVFLAIQTILLFPKSVQATGNVQGVYRENLPSITGKAGKEKTIELDAFDLNANFAKVRSSDKKIVDVNFPEDSEWETTCTTCEFEFKKAGKADVYLRFYTEEDGELLSEFHVTVTVRKGKSKISSKGKYTLKQGESFSLKNKITGDGKVTYSSNNKSVAMVKKNGKVICKKPGTAIITVKVKGTRSFSAASKKIKVIVKENNKPGKVKLGNWKRIVNNYSYGDGQLWRIKWDSVSGASGYQVKYYERESVYDSWYTWTKNTSDHYADIEFSSLYQFKVKVRAYKIINGKKVYGDWSEEVAKTIYD